MDGNCNLRAQWHFSTFLTFYQKTCKILFWFAKIDPFNSWLLPKLAPFCKQKHHFFIIFQVYSIWYKSTTKPNWNFQKKRPKQLYAPVFMASNGIWSIFKALQNVILPSTMSMPWKQDWISILWPCKKFWLIVLASSLKKPTCASVISWSVSADGFLSGEQKQGYHLNFLRQNWKIHILKYFNFQNLLSNWVQKVKFSLKLKCFVSFFRNTVLEPLAFAPTPTLVTLLNDFVQNNVFVDDEDEEKDDHSKIQELHKRRNFLASFSKLIIYNVLPTKHGADVFKHYVVFYNHYGEKNHFLMRSKCHFLIDK